MLAEAPPPFPCPHRGDAGQGHRAGPQLSWSQFSHMLEDLSGMTLGKKKNEKERAAGRQLSGGSGSTPATDSAANTLLALGCAGG